MGTEIFMPAGAVSDGVYVGTWSGHFVTFMADGVEQSWGTSVGIRSPSAPCEVTIRDGAATVQTLDVRPAVG